MKEAEIQRACLQYLELRGILHWRSNNAGIFNQRTGGYMFHGTKGVPDISVILPSGRYLGVEVKSEKGRVSPEQKTLHQRIVGTNAYVTVVRSVDELVSDLHQILREDGQ